MVCFHRLDLIKLVETPADQICEPMLKKTEPLQLGSILIHAASVFVHLLYIALEGLLYRIVL